MAPASHTGSATVQDGAVPAVAHSIDLTASDPASDAYESAKLTASGASTSMPKDDDSDDEVSDHGSLYEEILDEVDAFEYSTDVRLSRTFRFRRTGVDVSAGKGHMHGRRSTRVQKTSP